MNKNFLYLIWILGLVASALISYIIREPIPFMLWIIIIVASVWVIQAKALGKRVNEYESKQP